MVRSKNQSAEQFPFFQKNKNSQQQFKSDKIDRVLSLFAIGFFGIILLLISFDNSDKDFSSFSTHVKNSSIAKIAVTENSNLKNNKVASNKTKNTNPHSKVTTKKIFSNNTFPKAILVSKNIERKVDDSKKVEIINQPISYSSQPTYNIEKTVAPIIKAEVKKAIIPVANPTAKKSPNKLTRVKKEASSKKLTINSQITEDILPAAYFSSKELAKQNGKNMLIKFGAKWCLPCREMENTTFKNSKVLDFMDANYVTLSIDVDDFDGYNLKTYYNISALPTILVFDSQGEFLAKYANSMSTSKFMSVLENYQSQNIQPSPVAKNEIQPAAKAIEENTIVPRPAETPILATVALTNIVPKKKNGQALKNLKNKAKNWRTTSIEITTTNMANGQLIMKLKNLTSGEILNETSIPLKLHKNVGANTNTTTSIYQLDVSHEKKKDKFGEYAIEIYHASPQQMRLIGKTSFLKDGQFIWKK